jgi:ATP-binding cassette, subfamily B, bacterial
MRNYLRLLHYVRQQRGFLIAIFALTLLAAGLAAVQPWPMKLLIDHVLGTTPVPEAIKEIMAFFSSDSTATTLLALIVLGGLILFVISAAVDAILTWAWTVAGRRMVFDLAEDLFARFQRRSLLFHKRNAVGDTMSRITTDTWCMYQLTDTVVFAPFHALLTMAGMVFLMAQLDGTLTLLAVAIAPFMVGASFLLGKPLRAAAKLKREIESRIQSHIQQTLTGIPVVQAFGQEERENLSFQKFASEAIRSQQRGALLGSVNSLTSGLITTLGSGVILWVGARHVLGGSLSIGSILVFLVYLNALHAQIKIFANLYTALQGLSASVNRVVEALDAAPEIAEKPTAHALPSLRGAVQFENLWAGYDPDRPVLKNISLDVRPGETIAIVGATGVGKTTLVNLIPRFADPWQGRVLVDGCDVRNVQLKTLREQIAIVLQEPFLFPISVAENIAYGKPGASRSEIERAAHAANAHQFISALPNGYDTVIGERGGTLSGGERQRIAIARALLRNPPILILDEPTSALDAHTERQIIDALRQLMKDRTTFVIAHRLSTVRRADRIIVLKDGEIVETGTHQELLASRGHYARLHDVQNSPAATLPTGRNE